MYQAKGHCATHIYLGRVRVEQGELVELTDPDVPNDRVILTDSTDRHS